MADRTLRVSPYENANSTQRRPKVVVKKRSGPLEQALDEVNSQQQTLTLSTHHQTCVPALGARLETQHATESIQISTGQIQSAAPGSSIHRKSTLKERKEKKRERWLLTRKTWRYMTDAGRKLIPDGVQNRVEDIPKIEKHFHQICTNEPRFVLWRRKSSYPGATRSSKRRLKQILSHTGQKIPLSIEAIEQEEANNVDKIIDLLQKHLKLDEARKTTALLGSKTVRPDQTVSPSAQRPIRDRDRGYGDGSSGGAKGLGFPLPQPPKEVHTISEINQLLERLRVLSLSTKGGTSTTIPLERFTPDLFDDKTLLKDIYNKLKKQQLHRLLGRHCGCARSTSLQNFGNFSNSCKYTTGLQQKQDSTTALSTESITTSVVADKRKPTNTESGTIVSLARQRKPVSSLDLKPSTGRFLQQKIPAISIKKPSVEKVYNTCGTQTNFIPLQEIKRLAEEYKELRRANDVAGSIASANDDNDTSTQPFGYRHRRKSSIDNKDVSQSVSDTIKRYLRMARKKSVQDVSANRFKRVNYDQNLRNIRAKGEINPPGMDEENNRAVQTLDAWPVIALDFIRGNENPETLLHAHAEWQKALEDRIQKKLEYLTKISKENPAAVGGSSETIALSQQCIQKHSNSASAPTSPTGEQNLPTAAQNSGAGGLLHSSTQFLANLWHGTTGGCHQQKDSSGPFLDAPPLSTFSASTPGQKGTNISVLAMHKSKSSSHVGQFVTRKLLRSRSKSHTRPSPTLPKWMPAEKFTWTSENGGRITLTDVPLQELSEIEAKILQKVAIEKISELNIGLNVVAPDGEPDEKSTIKRRALSKKKAMTTSFFDIGKKEEKNAHFCLFENTLENCIANDMKRRYSLVSASTNRGSNSIVSLFRSSSSKVRSCESLPSSNAITAPQTAEGSGEEWRELDTENAPGVNKEVRASSRGSIPVNYKNLYSTIPMSRSQSDVRRSSHEYNPEFLHRLNNSSHTDHENYHQVPVFISSCIRHLEEYGLHLVGLFRVSTSKKRVRQLREDFDRNGITMVSFDKDICPHDVATLLKEFLRDLPEPLLCRSLYRAFLETQRIRNRRLQLEAISHLVKLLPPAHRDTLSVLLKFLARVAACSDDVYSASGSLLIPGNKMDSINLATVFAPNILRATLSCADSQMLSGKNGAVSEQESMADAINVIRIMIDHYEELFRVPAELINAVYTQMFEVCPQKLNFLCEQQLQYDTDDVGSGSSTTTPLSSPPPAGKPSENCSVNDSANDRNRQPTEGSDFSAYKIFPTEGAMSTTPVAPARRLYTRGAVMHENSASRGPTGNVSSQVVKSTYRSRHSKPKYSDSDSSVYGLLSGSSDSSVIAKQQHQQHLQHEHLREEQLQMSGLTVATSLRRQSSPFLSHKANVVSASLKIPVQMQIQSASAESAETIKRSNLSHLPKTEDASGNGLELHNFGEDSMVTGSLSFDATMYNKATTETMQRAIATVGAPVTCAPLAALRKSTTTTTTTHSISKPKASSSQQKQQPKKLARQMKISMQLKTAAPTTVNTSVNGNNNKVVPLEPKLPASISNIGGVLLHSKTADFERMLTISRDGDKRASDATLVTTNLQQQTEQQKNHKLPQQGTLYKRQTIISSAKRTTTTNKTN